MAVIDSKKLLPPSKSSGSALTTQKFLVPVSNIKVKSSAIIKASDITPEIKEGGDNNKTLLGEIVQIRKNVISVQKIIGDNNAIFKRAEEQKRKLLEKEKFAKKEKQLETKDTKQKISLPTPSLPRTGFLDAIKRFLFFTLLGAAFVKFGKHIPKILEFSKKLIPAFKFLEDFAGNLLNGVVDFVGAGYKAYDKVREITKQVGGEDLQNKFDEFSKQFNTFANLALIAGMSAMGGTDFSGNGGKSSAAKPGVDRVRGGRVDKATQSRYLSRYGKGAFTNRFGQQSLKGLTGKGIGRLAGKALGRIPIIGGLVDFIISTVIFKEKPGRAAAKAIGATIGSALGTFIPVPFAGTILGGIVGDLVGGALYDSLVGNDTLKAKAQGGQVTRGGKKVSGSSRRSIRAVRTRPPKIKPQTTIPGKDVGGKEEIKKLFPSSADPRQRNPLGVLETTSKNLKEIPLLGGIMGASVDLTMGQKPDASVFRKIGNGFGMLIQSAIDAETSNTIGNIQKEIVGLAGGGAVPRTLSTGESIGMKIGERLARTIEVMMNSKVNETLQSIRQQFTKEGFGLTGPDGGGLDGSRGPVTQDQQEAYEKIRKIAQKVGSPNPSVTAAIAMIETGWLSNPNSVYFASGKTNPFGQTGAGPKGFVIGKDGQKHAVYNNLEEGVKAHVDRWKSSYIGKTPQEIIESIRTGRGAGAPGMYNTNPNWTSKVLSALQSSTPPPAGQTNASIFQAAKSLKGMSTAAGPGGGNVSCVWAVNKVFSKARVPTPWGGAQSTDQVIYGLQRNKWLRVSARDARPGDVWVYDANDGRRGHVGIMMDNGRVLSNSSGQRKFVWEATPQQLLESYPASGLTPPGGAFYRAPGAQKPVEAKKQKPATKPTEISSSNIPGLSEPKSSLNSIVSPTKATNEIAQIKPTSPNLASGLNYKTQYEENAGGFTLAKQIVQVLVPMGGSGGGMISGGVNNSGASTSPITASLYSA